MGLRLYMRRYRRQSFVISDYITLFCCLCLVYIMNITLVFGTIGNVAVSYLTGESPSRADIKRTQMSSKVTETTKSLVSKGRRSLLHQPAPGGASVAIRMDSGYVGHSMHYLHNIAPSLPHRMQTTKSVLPSLSRPRSLYQINISHIRPRRSELCHRRNADYSSNSLASQDSASLLVGLFSVGIVLVVISALRFPFHQGALDTPLQTILSPIEELLSALVANVPTLYSLRRARQPETPPHQTQPSPKRFPRAVDSIIIMQTVDVEESRTDDQTLSTTMTDQALSTTMADRDLNDDSDGHLVLNEPE
ncbi:hypothetical protein AnigIFM60653_005925 [Aspergillus niger]|nr:hypothetical protein AnigIFM50267_007760 [Aspergillus niger]GLA05437.1 hypothetical protein AnigIFM60653_005925 [Aspergillus niger]